MLLYRKALPEDMGMIACLRTEFLCAGRDIAPAQMEALRADNLRYFDEGYRANAAYRGSLWTINAAGALRAWGQSLSSIFRRTSTIWENLLI